MKKLLGIVVLGLLLSSNAYAGSMIPLKQYIEENEQYLEDPITYTYILKRCSALYLYVATITKDKDQTLASAYLEFYRKLSLEAAQILKEKMDWTEDVAGKSVIKDLDKMVKYYSEDGQDSYARTGAYTENNYIGEDLRVCKIVIENKM